SSSTLAVWPRMDQLVIAHHRQFLKFCGLDLATCQSGTFRGRTKLSKYGNARLRRTFWMAAQVAARQRDNSFRDKLGRYTAGHADEASRRRKAMTALTAKMARVAHAVIKTGTEYRPFLERSDARWKDPSLQVPGGRSPSGPVDTVRAFHLGAYLGSTQVRATAARARRWILCLLWQGAIPLTVAAIWLRLRTAPIDVGA